MAAMTSADIYLAMLRAEEWGRDVPVWAESAFSMMQRHEKAMLWRVTKDFPRSIDCIVDAGCWLGASTLAFCRGIKDGGHPVRDNMVVSCDLFRVDDHAKNIMLQRRGMEAQIGASLLPAFLNTIRGHETMVSVVKGDLLDFRWGGRPIDILFLDLLKTRALNAHGSECFFPHLRAGSIIIQQDYVFDHLPWIPLTMEMFADHFVPVGFCDSSAIFLVRSVPSQTEVQERLAEMEALAIDRKLELFEQIAARMKHPAQRAQIELSRLWCALHYDGSERAEQEASHFRFDPAMAWVEKKRQVLVQAVKRRAA